MPIPELIGGRVRAARQREGMSQAELAQRIGVTRSAVSHLEAGHRDTTVTRLAAIVRVLPVDLSDVFGRVQAPAA